MPTPKQVRHHFAKCIRLHRQYRRALQDAHNADVIVYPDGVVSPICDTQWEVYRLFKQYTKDQLASAMETEILRTMK